MTHPPRSALWASFCKTQRHLTCASLALYQGGRTDSRYEALGTIADHAGQQGQGIGLTKDGVRSELIVDPSSGNCSAPRMSLSTRQLHLTPSSSRHAWSRPHGPFSWWSVIDSGIVASVSSTPAPSNRSNS